MRIFLIISAYLAILISCQQRTDTVAEPKHPDNTITADNQIESKPLNSISTDKTIDSPDSIIIFEYEYPHNTPDLIENHYIVLPAGIDKTIGRYYGTSDEFDPNREGYFPGFFVADMLDFQINGDSIKFKLKVLHGDMFTKAVDLKIKSPGEARLNGYQKWGSGPTEEKDYSGLILGDTIIIEGDFDTRHYIRLTKD